VQTSDGATELIASSAQGLPQASVNVVASSGMALLMTEGVDDNNRTVGRWIVVSVPSIILGLWWLLGGAEAWTVICSVGTRFCAG